MGMNIRIPPFNNRKIEHGSVSKGGDSLPPSIIIIHHARMNRTLKLGYHLGYVKNIISNIYSLFGVHSCRNLIYEVYKQGVLSPPLISKMGDNQ